MPLILALGVAALVAAPFMARDPEVGPVAAWATSTGAVLMPLVLAAVSIPERLAANLDEARLPRSLVTVLGFDARDQDRVVVTPGVVDAECAYGEAGPGAYDDVYAVKVWLLGDLVAGDVIVCDGKLHDLGLVHLATETDQQWSSEVFRVRR